MPFFGKNSKEKLATCHPDLQRIANEAIKIMDFSVIWGHRGEEDQNKCYAKRTSTVKWPYSKHNPFPSLAMDVCPYPEDWDDRDRFILLAGIIIGVAYDLGVPIIWGGDWNSNFYISDEKLQDLGHFQLNSLDKNV